MTTRRVCVVITARPSYSRVKSLLKAINNHDYLELQLVLAGSALLDRYGNAAKTIEADGFYVNEKIYNIIEGETSTGMAKTTGLAIMELSTTFYNLKPHIVVTIADRFETLATSISASYQNIPLAHIQGGEVTGNIDEKVRHANTKLADIHFVSTEEAKQRVIKLGEASHTVINTGCPSMDLAKEVLDDHKMEFDPIEKYGGVGDKISWEKGYLVVMQHPVTTEYEKSRLHILETLLAITSLDIPTFWFWPNVDAGSDGTSKGIRQFREKGLTKNIYFFKNTDPKDFLILIKNSICLVGNSSAGIRECSFLGVPSVNIGTRQSKRERADNVLDCNYKSSEIINCIRKHIKSKHFRSSKIYGRGDSGIKIADELSRFKLRFHKTITY